MWIKCSIVLLVVVVCLLAYILMCKRQMRNIGKELEATRAMDYNRQVTISLLDKDMTEMTAQINRNLDYQKKMKLESEKTEKQLRESISDIAHDLRTPVTVIKGNLQMLQREEGLSEKQREYLKICEAKTDLLKNMVDVFFELSYLESEEVAVNLKKIDVTELLAYFMLSHEAVIREKGMEPTIEMPEKSLFIKADEQMINRMLENLFNNVVKHGGDRFTVSLSEYQEFVREDTGKGIGEGENASWMERKTDREKADREKAGNSQGNRFGNKKSDEIIKNKVRIEFSNPVSADASFNVEHLFDRAYRGNKARTGGGPGGLGLYIVKLLGEKQNASVSARREADRLYINIVFDLQTLENRS